MTSESIEKFLQDNAEVLRKLANRRDVSLGFNAFALMSDVYKRENFHSDILRAILDPNSGHGEGTLFLRKFISFLSGLAREQDKCAIAKQLDLLPFNGPIEVTREEGRVDVKITAPSWAIIIENKINGACDMPRQIPRYIEDCGGLERVKAVVYLTAAEEMIPKHSGWSDSDIKMVDMCLLPVVGYSEDKTHKNLVEGWLEPCELLARAFSARSVLSQYEELVRNQAGVTMNEKTVGGFVSSMARFGLKYSEIFEAVECMPGFLARKVKERFVDAEAMNKYGVDEVDLWHDTVCYVNFKKSKNVVLAIDICCGYRKEWSITVFRRDYEGKLDGLLPILQGHDSRFMLNGRVEYAIDSDWAFGHVEAFIDEVEKLVAYIGKHIDELAGVFSKKGKLEPSSSSLRRGKEVA